MISDESSSVSYLNSTSLVDFQFDSLVTSHDQVNHMAQRLTYKFLHGHSKSEKDKIVLNFADSYNCNNNAGFNMTNFKVKFIN